MRCSHRLIALPALIGALALSAACADSPDRAKHRHLAKGDDYVAHGHYKEGIVEYRNAVQQDPKFGEARYRLAEALAKDDRADAAFREFVRAADLLPGNVDVQIKAGSLLLLARQFREARDRAEQALRVNPRSVEAQILRANAMAGVKNMIDAVLEMEDAISMDPEHANSYTNLGAIQFARGKTTEAEAAFNKAVAVNPKSLPAHLALANYYMAVSRPGDAERILKETLELDPADLSTNRALATFYMAEHRYAAAEAPLRIVAERAPGAAMKIKLADYYIAANREDEALRVLEPLARSPQNADDVNVRIAAVYYAKGKRTEAHEVLNSVLQRRPVTAALILKARLLLGESHLDTALEAAQQAVATSEKSATAHFVLGSILVAHRRMDEAAKEFYEAIRLNPRADAARLQLSHTERVRGAITASVQVARELIQLAPTSGSARLALVRGLIANDDLATADKELQVLVAQLPRVSEVQALLGSVRLQQRNLPQARRAFVRALELDPDSFDGLAGLVTLDIVEGKPTEAAAAAEERLARTPQHAPTLRLAARAHESAGHMVEAEQALRRAIAADTSDFEAYSMLGSLLIRLNRLNEARTELLVLAARQPHPVAALTMIAMIDETQGNLADARARYERALDADPTAPVPANNLAMIYLKQDGNLDVALSLAQVARRGLPHSTDTADTLGELYLRKNLPTLAIEPLQQCVEQAPASHRCRYQLGVAYARAGDARKARVELTRALQIKEDFEGADDARTMLASLAVPTP